MSWELLDDVLVIGEAEAELEVKPTPFDLEKFSQGFSRRNETEGTVSARDRLC